MPNTLIFIVPPCVPLADLILDENKAFSNKIRKEIPLGAVSLATYMKSYTKSKVHVLDLNLEFYDLVNGNKTALTTGVLFLLALPFGPLFTSIPGFATAPALIFVGFLLFSVRCMVIWK